MILFVLGALSVLLFCALAAILFTTILFGSPLYRAIAGAIILIPCGWLGLNWWVHTNPYSDNGLNLEWHYGATSTVPSVEVWAEHNGKRIDCPVFFGGINFPDLRFYDFDGDGHRDIVFENRKYKQVVAFFPGNGTSDPHFTVIRNDVTWP